MKQPTPFDFEEYREFLRAFLKSMPKSGHGQLAKIAKQLRVHPTLLTQILSGAKPLSLEHGLLIGEYLGLNENEAEYFLCLVERERAGHFKLRNRAQAKLQTLKALHEAPQGRMTKHKVLPEANQAIFYSEWFYSAIRLLAGLKGFDSAENIAEELALPRRTVKAVLEFLLANGLVVKKGATLKLGPQRTYLPASSPLVSRHHTNWRIKAIENFPVLNDAELAFTAPLSVSRRDFKEIKAILLKAIEDISSLVDKSEEEAVACLNLDLFMITKR